jgi:Lon protease-like protein
MRMPVFPLNVVLVPGLVLPLHIFELRYREMVEQLLAQPESGGREFGIIGIRDGRSVEIDGLQALYDVGVVASLREVEALDDGRYNIVTSGTRRFRLRELDDSRPLLQAEVDLLEDLDDPDDVVLAATVRSAFDRYRMLLGARLLITSEAPAERLPSDPGALAYLVTAAMVLPNSERQQLLAAPSTSQRLSVARRFLARECALIEHLASVPSTDLGQFIASPN